MCGVAGAVSGEWDATLGPATLAATRALRHRGPDGEGFWLLGPDGHALRAADRLSGPAGAVLGHRRLSIVDIEGGAQPMSSDDGAVWVSFNGEIYNHLDLRAQLERAGHAFRTRADTEVLVHGWKEWGADLFGKLNGIFAFALVDTRTDEIILARDPMGVKPLYVGSAGGRTWWASELTAARAAGWLSNRLSLDALKLLLTFRFVPSPLSVHEEAWKIPPGHLVRLHRSQAGSRPAFRPYVSEVRSRAHPETPAEWSAALVEELGGAVERQLMADVPLASLLSGGVDSSLVTCLMSRHLGYAPEAFGIGFESDGDRSEARVAEEAARRLEVPYRAVEISDSAYIDGWSEALAELGEPVANTGMTLVSLLCEHVGRSHKVVLTGQGADEPLGGYPRHVVERVYPFGRFAPWIAGALVRLAVGSEEGARLRTAMRTSDPLDRYARTLSVIPFEDVDAAFPGDSVSELAHTAVARWVDSPNGDSLNGFLRVDARMSLADDLLLVADHYSMRSSVELRVPLLDLQLLDLLERMPSRFKVSRLAGRKWLYRRSAVAECLPETLAERLAATGPLQRKRGFSTPLRNWFTLAGGELARPVEWREPLIETLRIDARSLESLLGRPEETRRRALLYTLATWLKARPELELA
jgi:asparagine synthase (glutamine-hydrolysing)